jgi:ABC-2 type transport system permease protein
MRPYLSAFRIRFINGLQYRASALGEMLSRCMWAFMEILAFQALYKTGESGFSMELSQTVSYIWMQQIFYILFKAVYGDEDICASIAGGSVAYELVRPAGLYGRWFCHAAAVRLSYTALNSLPVFLVAVLLPAPYGMVLPEDMGQILLFLLSSLLALGVVAAFAMLMYISMFYTLSHRGLKIIVTAVTDFFSGGLIPLPFFPEPVLAVVDLLPFAAMRNVPLLMYSGGLSGSTALQGIALQVFWLTVLVLMGRLAMKKVLGKVIVQGG